jgi:HlyD family secretion protein
MKHDVPRLLRPSRLRARLALALSLLACVLTAAACKGGEAPRGEAPKEKPKRAVLVVRAQSLSLAESVSVTGTLAAQDRVVVSAKVAGRLAAISVDLGSKVARGQSIAQVETADYRLRVAQSEAAVASARALLGLPPDGDDAKVDVERTPSVRQAHATLEEASKNRDRSQQLLERKLIGHADYDAVQANLARAESAIAGAREEVYNRLALLRQRKAELMIAQKALLDATLVSPLDGVVQMRQASVGELLTVGTPVATLVRIDPLRLRLEIPDSAAGGVAVGQDVRVLPGVGKSYPAKIARVAPALDEQNRTLTVEAEVPNPGDLRPGSFVTAEVDLGASSSVVAVPVRALVAFAGIEKVLTIKDGKALEVVVQTGRRSGDLVEVKSGLSLGSEVVLDPGNLQTGDPVAPSPAEEKSRAEAG